MVKIWLPLRYQWGRHCSLVLLVAIGWSQFGGQMPSNGNQNVGSEPARSKENVYPESIQECEHTPGATEYYLFTNRFRYHRMSFLGGGRACM